MNYSLNTRTIVVEAAAGAGTSALTSDSVDLAGYDSVAFTATIGTANAGNIFHLEGSDDDSNWDDVAGSALTPSANNNPVVIEVNKPLKRYIRIVLTRGASTSAGTIYATLGNSKKSPDTAGDVLTLASPADGTP